MRTRDRGLRSVFWTPFGTAAAGSGGLHTLVISVTGLVPSAFDNLNLWAIWFLYASAVPVFVVVVVGLVLAPRRSRLGAVGKGLVFGAIASPFLWLVCASLVDGD
jgi:hypothetical protein